MKNYRLIIGVDVSKVKLDIVGINLDNKLLLPHKIIENKFGKIKSFFLKAIKNYNKQDVLVSFENTGVYGRILATVMNLLNIDYCELSALEIFRSSGIKRGKSDKIDALVIAQYTIANSFNIVLSSPNKPHITQLKLLYTQREKVLKAIKQFQSNSENKDFIDTSIYKQLTKTNNSILGNLKKNLNLVEAQIKNVITSDNSLNTNWELIKSIPGVGPQTATYLLIITKNFTCFNDPRKLACYCGVAPFPYQSGSSIKGKNKVSHLADKKLKSLLNMCALSIKKNDPEIKLYYNRKLEQGKNKMLIVNNIRNKILTRVFAVIKRQQPYVKIQKFAM